jgi:hypothetical protein
VSKRTFSVCEPVVVCILVSRMCDRKYHGWEMGGGSKRNMG